MDERQSAEIIQFPPPRVNNVGRVPAPLPPAPEVEASPDLARARLMLALASLEAIYYLDWRIALEVAGIALVIFSAQMDG